MALVIGHSQVKYLSDYLDKANFSVFSYPGYGTLNFLREDDLFDVAPFFSIIAVVVGANDISMKPPKMIVAEILNLCNEIHSTSPSATVLVSTILPRVQNMFEGKNREDMFLRRWNNDAYEVNYQLRVAANRCSWIHIIEHPQFYTLFGPNKRVLSKDGLHLSYDGTDVVAENIDRMVNGFRQTKDISPMLSTTEKPPSCPKRRSHSPSPVVPPTVISPILSTTEKPPSCPKRRSHSPSHVVPPTVISPILSSTKKPHSCPKRRSHSPIPFVQRKTLTSVTLVETPNRFYLSTDVVKLIGGGKEVPVYSTTDTTLTHDEAAAILLNSETDAVTTEPPYRPAPGSIYIFNDSDNPSRKEDWRADGYTWRDNGRRLYRSHGKSIQRIFFKISNQGKVTSDFQKHVYRFQDEHYNGRTVLVYFGNNEAYKLLPHGNRKNNNRQFKRTMPSVINNIKSQGLSHNPKDLIDKIKSESSPESNLRGIKVPRNDKQIKNLHSNMRKEAFKKVRYKKRTNR